MGIVQKINDQRLHVYTKPNEGVSAARNFGISKATRDSIYTKDGTCYYDWCGKFLPIEENPYYGDTAIGEWGTYRYRYKVVYDNKKYCQQGWCYHYFNF